MRPLIHPTAQRFLILLCAFTFVILTCPTWRSFLFRTKPQVNSNSNSYIARKLEAEAEVDLHLGVKHADKVMSGQILTAEAVFGGTDRILDQSDPGLLNFIRLNHIFPPSTEPYNLSNPLGDPSVDNGKEWKTVQSFLGNKTNGFFIECGANDGEFFSNTLVLERDFGWKGILIESDPEPLELLFKKHRKAWVANLCLSVNPYPQTVTMTKVHWGKEQIFGGGVVNLNTAKPAKKGEKQFTVKCVPFFSIMSAIGVFEVDFFAMDVDFSEFPILQTIPFDKIFIKVLVIEVYSPRTKDVVPFMKSKGYRCMGVLVHYSDYVFVHERLFEENPGLPKPFGKCKL
jgi:hypothetical protein